MNAAAVTIPNPLAYNSFGELLTNGILPAVAGLVGTLAVIMIIVAGILYLISAGNPGRIETAKKALIYAIAGIVISMLATAAVSLIKSALGAQ